MADGQTRFHFGANFALVRLSRRLWYSFYARLLVAAVESTACVGIVCACCAHPPSSCSSHHTSIMSSSSSSPPQDGGGGAPPPTATGNAAGSSTAEGIVQTTSIAIVLGGSSTSGNNKSAAAFQTIPVVVWACHERTRQSQQDAWKHTLEYFEFLEDTAKWSHLDQLLLRYPSVGALHVCDATTTTKQQQPDRRRERLMENLQVFLEERHVSGGETACHVHSTLPDVSKIDSAVTQLLLQDADVQVAYRGNLQLSKSLLLKQGLAVWLSGQGLLEAASMDPVWEHSLRLQPGVLTSHLVLDRTAAACVHLLPPTHAGEQATIIGGHLHNNSLWGLLQQPCQTTMGPAKLQVWLRQPLIDLDAILYRQRAVTALVQGMGKDSLHQEGLASLAGVDLAKLAAVLDEPDATKKSLKALYQLYLLSAKQLPELLRVLEELEQAREESQLLQDAYRQVGQLTAELAKAQGLAEAVLDLEAAGRGEYLVQPSHSSELAELHSELETIQCQVDDELAMVQEEWAAHGDQSVIKLETVSTNNGNDGWQFRIADTNAGKILEARLPNMGVQMHRVLKNGVYFSTRTLRGLSSQYQQTSAEYAQHSSQIVHNAWQVAVTYQTVVERAAQVVGTLDVITALARVAAYSPHGYCKPTLTDSDDETGIEVRRVELDPDFVCLANFFLTRFIPSFHLDRGSPSSVCRTARRHGIHSQ